MCASLWHCRYYRMGILYFHRHVIDYTNNTSGVKFTPLVLFVQNYCSLGRLLPPVKPLEEQFALEGFTGGAVDGQIDQTAAQQAHHHHRVEGPAHEGNLEGAAQ